MSLIALLGGIGLLMFAVGRYNLLGWHRADEEEPGVPSKFRSPEEVRLTPAQRATAEAQREEMAEWAKTGYKPSAAPLFAEVEDGE